MSRRAEGADEIVVFWTRNDSRCDGCGEELWRGSLLRVEEGKAFCLSCSDLDHLVFLPRGDPALTRRAGTEVAVAEHACLKYSGRVGRSPAAKRLDPEAIDLAVRAHVRHRRTAYDRYLMSGWDRAEARAAVEGEVEAVLAAWRG